MRKVVTFIISTLCLVLSTWQTAAAQDEPAYGPSPTAQLSLITCQPGNPMYSKYGHTAIHLLDTVYGIDCIFNYGVFDFREKNFIAKFLTGKSMYQLDVEPAFFFYESCREVGREKIYHQPLNLNYQQKCKIIEALIVNLQPDKRFYPYNFVFNNCATKSFRVIQRTLDDTILAPQFAQREDSFRDLIDYYSGTYTWARFGIDMLFGRDADRIMKPEERLFLPEQLMDYLSEATLATQKTKLVADDAYVGPFEPVNSNPLTSPQLVQTLILLLSLILIVIDRRRAKPTWAFDAILLFILAIMGIVVWFVAFFSSHPLVGHNINILWLNPLMFIPAIMTLFRRGRQLLQSNTSKYIFTAYFVITMVIIAFWGQSGPCIILPLALALHVLATWFDFSAKKPHTNKAAIALLLTLSMAAPAYSQQPARLTVVALVDGMSQQAMNRMREYWQTGGLRTIAEEAANTQLQFNQLCYGGAEMTTTLFTGNYPNEHGVSANTYMQTTDRTTQYIFYDSEQAGIGTTQKLSATNIKTLTTSDYMRLRYGDDAKIYAIGLNTDNVIPMAGHSANACCWLDEKTQRWVSTSYYPEGLPAAADAFNVSQRISELTEQTWTPRMSIDMYLEPTYQELKQKGFSYQTAKVLHHSPTANRLVTELALSIQKKNRLGMDNTPDLLMLEYTVVSPKAVSDNLLSAEQEDMYLCLNQDFGYLIDQLRRQVGADNLRVIVVGKPEYSIGKQELEAANIEVIDFDVNRAAALLNTYLMAIYGHERWIDGGCNQSIFINRLLIEKKQMSLTELQQQVALFLMEFDGVTDAYPAWQIPMLQPAGKVQMTQNSFYRRLAGDVVFRLEDNCRLTDSEVVIDRILSPAVTTPLFILPPSSKTNNGTSTFLPATSLHSIILSD